MSEWISVKDEIPDDGVYVLVYVPSFARTDKHEEKFSNRRRPHGVRFGSYIAALNMIRPEGCNGGPYGITHWQSLPESPEVTK